MKKPKNIPTYYESTGTPIYRDTTALPFLDGGPLVDKTNHGKLLNSVYASALGNYYRTGGQFPRPYSLPEDSFKQGGDNLHNSVYASSMAQYPATYKYGGSFDMPRQQMYMPLDNVERYGGYQQTKHPNQYAEGGMLGGPGDPVKPKPIYVTNPNDPRLLAHNDSLSRAQLSHSLMNYADALIAAKTQDQKKKVTQNYIQSQEKDNYYKKAKGAFKRHPDWKGKDISSKYKKSWHDFTTAEDDLKLDDAHAVPYKGSLFIGLTDYPNELFPFPKQKVILKKSKVEPTNVDWSKSSYEKKYPPIYLSDPNDPRIDGYAEAGNQYLYKPVAPKTNPKVEILNLPTKKLPQLETEIIPTNYNYIPQKYEPIQVANRSQTIMEADPDREGKYRVKELRQVPYSAYFPGEGWQPANAPRVLYIDSKGNEVEERPKEFKNGGSILSMSNTPQLEGEGKDLTYPDGAYVYDGGGDIRISPFSYHGDTPGLYRFSTQNPTFNINYSQPFGERVAKDQGFESFSGGLTARLPYKSDTKIGVEGNLRAVGRPNRSSTMTVETDLSGGWDPNVGPYANFIASPQFMFGNVSPTKSKVYGTGLHGGEYLGKVGPFLGASFTPRPQAFTAHANDAKKGAVETTPQAGGMPFGVKGSIDFGLGRKGIRAGLSGYLGADLMGMGLKRSDAQLEGPEVQQGGLGIRTNYGAQANLTIPIKSAKSYVKNIIDEKKAAETELQDSNPRYASAPKFKNGGVIRTSHLFADGGPTDPPWKKYGKLTYKNNADIINGIADFNTISKVDISPEYNEQIKHRLYTGNYGFDPVTGLLYKLNTSERGQVSKEDKNILQTQKNSQIKKEQEAEYLNSVIQAGYDPVTFGGGYLPKSEEYSKFFKQSGPRNFEQLKHSDPDTWTEEEKKIWSSNGFDAAMHNPLFQAAAMFTPEGAAIAAIHGLTSLAPDLYNKEYGKAVFDAAQVLPFMSSAKNIVRGIAPEYAAGFSKLKPGLNTLKQNSILLNKKLVEAAGKLPDSAVNRRLEEFTKVSKRTGKPQIGSTKELETALKTDLYRVNKLKKQYPELDFNDPNIEGFMFTDKDRIERIPELLKGIQQNRKSGESFGKYIMKDYGTKMDFVKNSGNKALIDVIDESPQYLDEVYGHLKDPKGTDADFLNDLTVKSNTYTRFMNRDYSNDLDYVKQLKGKNIDNSGYSMDVEGVYPSNYYGSYGYKIQPSAERVKEITSAPLEQKWSLRQPTFQSDIKMVTGMHTGFPKHVKDYLKLREQRLDRMMPGEQQYMNWMKDAPMETYPLNTLRENLPATFLESKYFTVPQHQVFNTKKIGTKLENFDVYPLGKLDVPEHTGFNTYDYNKFFEGTGKGFEQGGPKKTITTVPTQEEAMLQQASTKGIPYADKAITLPEVTVSPRQYVLQQTQQGNLLDQAFQNEMLKKADWERRSSGAAQPVDWVWTLPLAATRAPFMAGEALSGLMATEIPGLAGTNIGQAINAGFIGKGLYDAPSTVGAWQDVAKGKKDWKEAAEKTAWNLLDFTGAGETKEGLKLLGEDARVASNYLTTQTPLKNAYKLNPWAFKPNPELYYRGIGKAGLEDARNTGLFRQAAADSPVRRHNKVWWASNEQGFNRAKDFSPNYIAEVPRSSFPETGDEFFGLKIPTRGTERHIPIKEGRILQKDWLKGYKEVPVELPGSPNAFKSIIPSVQTPYIDEIIGSFKNKNRTAQLREAEDWTNSWVQHPGTQEKILDSYKKALQGKRLTPTEKYNLGEAMGYSANYNAQNRLGEYPLLGQGLGRRNIHSDNAGVSYTHYELPGQILPEPTNTFNSSKNFKDLIKELDPMEIENLGVQTDPKYGNWISRTLGEEQRISTGVHELSHDWVKDYVLKNTELSKELTSGLDDFRIQEIIDRYKGTKLEDKVLKELEYFEDPTELFARLMESRRYFNISPGQKVTPKQVGEYLDLISAGKTPIDHVFGKIISRGKKGADFFNNPWLWTGVAVGGTQIGNSLLEDNTNKKEFKTGGQARVIKSSQLIR